MGIEMVFEAADALGEKKSLSCSVCKWRVLKYGYMDGRLNYWIYSPCHGAFILKYITFEPD